MSDTRIAETEKVALERIERTRKVYGHDGSVAGRDAYLTAAAGAVLAAALRSLRDERNTLAEALQGAREWVEAERQEAYDEDPQAATVGAADDMRAQIDAALARAAVADGGEQAECDGSTRCPATVHIHGCYSDNGTNCDYPAFHAGGDTRAEGT